MKKSLSPAMSAGIIAAVVAVIAVVGMMAMRGQQSQAPTQEDMKAMQEKAMQQKSRPPAPAN